MSEEPALLSTLRSRPRHEGRIEAVHVAAESTATLGPWPPGLHPALLEAAAGLGIDALYEHQSRAVAAALAGDSMVVATGTASGKSLCYLLPTLDALLRDEGATALYLFPTKALGRDQLDELGQWAALLPRGTVAAAAYDGDTPPGDRRRARAEARILVTNPDMLHAGILPHHPRWERLMAGLRVVVVDEMHVFRGVFGSHVANVLRRLRRVARHYGADPTFVLTSATVANPGDLGAVLAGGPVRVVDQDTAPHGRRALVFYNPPIVNDQLNLRRSAVLEAADIARLFLRAGVQTILFARTRHTTELLVRYVADGQPGTVRGYRGGYTPSERRAIEAGLRNESIRCVVATNALELGIDIGRLDACVMAGYPGTIASTWQQAGRAGRRAGESVAVMVATASPLDQYIVRHPEYFFQRSPEQARVDPDNLLVLLDHVRCAVFELPFGDDEARLPFGGAASAPRSQGPGPPAARELLSVLAADGEVKRASNGWYWMGATYPAARVGLRSIAGDDIVVSNHEGSAGTGAPVAGNAMATVPRFAAATTLHPGAIYLHDGAAHHVDHLDLEAGIALVRPADGSYYTRASSTSATRPTRVDRARAVCGADAACGELEIVTQATAFRRVKFKTHETLGWGAIDLPEQSHVAGAYWFTFDEEAMTNLVAAGILLDEPSDRGPNWRRQRELALERDGACCRRCGAGPRPGRSHDVHHVRPYRAFQNSGGVDWQAANSLDNLLTLCRPCHRAAEAATGFGGALAGMAEAMVHVASLHLMCDRRDLGVTAEVKPSWTPRPTVAIHEQVSGGVGFGPALFDLHEDLVADTWSLVADCPCPNGCPSCVGAGGESDPEVRSRALALLSALGAGEGQPPRKNTRAGDDRWPGPVGGHTIGPMADSPAPRP